jgi:antitoxin component YwqK of YwqJK toxin-antitoxin module
MKAFYCILFIAACYCMMGCYSRPAGIPEIPATYVNADNNKFRQRQGVLYLDHQPFSGHQYLLYENGDTAFVLPFSQGREYGIARQWYPNRQLKEVRVYENGKKSGKHTGWWENGRLKFIYQFKKDVFDGPLKEWHANGQPFRSMNYIEGQESGLQQIHLADGSLYANYEVRNGRNYGLTGTRHCKNYWKDAH